ncbi:MAG: hypothetical protein HY782_01595 [Chloroflexi bacterium]|nr:hypothetical protein [Chloroflexota bacterium]
MHLQQTKRASRATGGPQYYFHDLTEPVKLYLRQKGVVSVALVTPYGATKSDFFAVSRDRKLGKGQKPEPGQVGHDRVQQGYAGQSIGEAIRHWYNLPSGDFERIDVDIEIFEDVFYITPLYYKLAHGRKQVPIRRIPNSLTFTRHYISPLWTEQLADVERHNKGIVHWSLEEICRIVADHRPKSRIPHIQEPDLLRASGPLAHLGLKLGAYVGKGYDCVETSLQFLRYPAYTVPLEIKKRSRDFQYQEKKYGKAELSRALVLCAFHDHEVMPKHIDVIELDALCEHASHFDT